MYKEILKLKEMLEKEHIPFSFKPLFGGFHIVYPENGERVCSVIEHKGIYGNEEDLLEIKGLLTDAEKSVDDVLGYLSAEKVFGRIKADSETRKNQLQV